MSREKTTLEVIAPTVEEAVENGLSQLGLPPDAVHVEVLDSGSRGLFGLGGRQARVRLTIQNEDAPRAAAGEAEPRVAMPAPAPSSTATSVQEEKPLKVASQVVRDLLERMKVTASVSARYLEPEDSKDQQVVMVEIRGEDLSILIGRRSETLNSLQYITSLVVCKELGKWTPIMIDVQGYRSRRERQLRQLARRMADQAIHTGRRQVLEPMPANERRLIHMELRDHPQVTTESIGEEPGRKVTISLKK
ncbi:MAG: RNA-binding cell elongation regulator Jag/EloR [Anaerolineaceae bacterium]|jgi:spoIIIJ-associated protein